MQKKQNEKKSINELLMKTKPKENILKEEDKDIKGEENLVEKPVVHQDSEMSNIELEENSQEELDISDDEFILSMQDEVIDSDKLSALVEQVDIDKNENLIYFKINGVFDEKSKTLKYRSKGELMKEPPTLEVADMKDNSVHFNLTKEVTRELIESLEEVQRAYYGYGTPKRESNAENIPEFIEEFAKENPMKALLVILVAIILIISIIK